MNPRMYAILSLIALSAIFTLQNFTVIEVRFLFWQLEMSLVLMIIFLIIIGIVVGWLLHSHLLHSEKDKEEYRQQ
jgi:uncharacterized integral membrane protein